MNFEYKQLGLKLKSTRESLHKSMAYVADSINVDRTYISKIESGLQRPSKKILIKITAYYGLTAPVVSEMFELAKYVRRDNHAGTKIDETLPFQTQIVKEVRFMSDDQEAGQVQKGLKVNLHDKEIQTLYSDAVYMSSNPFGIVFNFAVSVGPVNEQNVIARIGMSHEHAQAMLEVLKKHLEGLPKKAE